MIEYTRNPALNAHIERRRQQRRAAGLEVDGKSFATKAQVDDYLKHKHARELWDAYQDGLLSSEKPA